MRYFHLDILTGDSQAGIKKSDMGAAFSNQMGIFPVLL
jgi:hypothetical protein